MCVCVPSEAGVKQPKGDEGRMWQPSVIYIYYIRSGRVAIVNCWCGSVLTSGRAEFGMGTYVCYRESSANAIEQLSNRNIDEEKY